MEKVAYAILLVLAALWLLAVLIGLVAALPYGLVGLLGLGAVGLLLVKVLRERLANKEDDYYAKNVER